MARAARRMAQGAIARRGRATGRTRSIPAPVGGLNAVDSLSAMPPQDAIICDNFFPQPTSVALRNGYQEWTTNLASYVETLMGYTEEDGTESLFGISGTSVYDCSSAGPIGGTVVTGLTNARWEYVNVSAPGGNYLYAANALDKPLFYDGSAWVKVDGITTPAITGVTTTKLRNPAVWKNRLWFVEDQSTLAWYLPVQQIGGAATSLDLATVWRLGGSLWSILTFSLSSATSFDDYIGFLSTEGELAVYQGTDPSDPTAFAIVGVYKLGKPVGRRCWFKYGADAVIICSDGLVSVSRIISVGIQQPKDMISYKIMQLINADIAAYGTNFGWEGTVYPLGNKIIINVPQVSNSRVHQYVQNTVSDAWCSFGLIQSPWNANTFCVLGDTLYFGGNTKVYKADTGSTDNGAQIFGSLKPAFSYFGTNRQKRFTMVRPIVLSAGIVTPALGINLDFNDALPAGTPTFVNANQSLWNVALWNVSYWSTGPFIQMNWQTVYGIGFSATVYMTLASKSGDVSVLSFDWVLEDGGTL